MSFVSLEFIGFFAVIVLVCSRIGHLWQNRLLVAASYVFYGWWDWRFLGLILVSSLVDYRCGIELDDEQVTRRRRKLVLLVSIVVNLGILGTFKYYGFFASSLRELAEGVGFSLSLGSLDIILPVGVSFYTFQSMSYTIDIYRKKLRATRRLGDFLLYVAFFPQLVAGPIERATHLLPQVQRPRRIDANSLTDGAQLMLFGFFKKMVIADNLAVYVDSVYSSELPPHGISVLLATYAFAFQIYADFSGYTDIARGAARMLGFDLRANFRMPYFATNPSDFWQRWHVSLSSWLRDYLYIPLGGNRGARWLTYRNLFITMLLGGLWHGAAFHFVVWGAYHGLLLMLFHYVASLRAAPMEVPPSARGPWFWVKALSFFQLTCMGWLLFRAADMTQVNEFGSALLTMANPVETSPVLSSVLLVATYAIPLLVFDVVRYRSADGEPWKRWPVTGQVSFLFILFYGIVLLGAPHGTAFLYFKF